MNTPYLLLIVDSIVDCVEHKDVLTVTYFAQSFEADLSSAHDSYVRDAYLGCISLFMPLTRLLPRGDSSHRLCERVQRPYRSLPH